LIKLANIKVCVNIEDQGCLQEIKGANIRDQGCLPVGTLDLFWVTRLNV